MATKNKSFSQVRQNIESAMEAAEEERRKKLLNQRLSLARSGILAYQKRQFAEAVKAFHAYIRILEEIKNVAEGELMPSYFDLKKDISELLMISGIYWDLVKLYDRTSSADKQREFHHYMEKYIIFSKGMPFQPLCAETLRKYLYNEKPVHRKEFKNTYNLLAPSKCFVVSSLIDVIDPRTLSTLREFRDEVLKTTPFGRKLVLGYYRHGPQWARWMDRMPDGARQAAGKLFDYLGMWIRIFSLK